MTSLQSDEASLCASIVLAEDDDEESLLRIFDAATGSNSTAGTVNNEEDDNKDDFNSSTTTLAQSPTPELRKRIFILEPAVFLASLAMYLYGTVYQNQILYQTCIAVYNYNDTDCVPLLGVSTETPEAQRIETEIQPYVARLLMVRSILESIMPAIVSLFLGPWSDKFGRRPILLTSIIGYLIGFCILDTLTFISTKVVISPWIFLFSSIPSALSGGTCALVTGVFCYISDVAEEKSRPYRIALNGAALCAGMLIANVASGYIYGATNVITVFAISTFLMSFALLYVYVFVAESLKPEQIHKGSKIREFFRLDLAKELIRTCFRRRPNFDRAIIWLTVISLTVTIFAMEGDGNVTYFFLRKKFDWTLKDYSLFNAASIMVQVGGSIIGMILLRHILKFSIVAMTMSALACCVLESTVRATAVYWWELYIGMVVGMIRGIVSPMSIDILTSVAPEREVGKIMALTTSLQFIVPLGAAPLYTIVYNTTLELNPGAFNFISAGLYLLCFTMISTIWSIQKSLGSAATSQAIES